MKNMRLAWLLLPTIMVPFSRALDGKLIYVYDVVVHGYTVPQTSMSGVHYSGSAGSLTDTGRNLLL